MTLPSSSTRQRIFSAAILLVAVVCAVLAFLQYRWIGEVADAEQQRMRHDLQRNLDLVRRDFDSSIAAASRALVPSNQEVAASDREHAYLQRYREAPESTRRFFSRFAIAIPRNGELTLRQLDPQTATLRQVEWPLGWAKLREALELRLAGQYPVPEEYRPEDVIEVPRFADVPQGDAPRPRREEQEWLILEYNREYLRNELLPSVLRRYLSESGQPLYSVVVTETKDPWQEVLRWGPKISEKKPRPDAWTTLYERDFAFLMSIARNAEAAPGPPTGSEDAPDPPPGHGYWTIRANHPAGSLESIVAHARRRNLFLALGLLALLGATVIALVRFTRGAEQFAEMQINFVSGVSHELRTPLSVLRAAGFNLRTQFTHQPEQVERYGRLIQEESEKLTTLVEQILRYGRARSGRILGPQEVCEVVPLLEAAVPADARAHVEQWIEPDLPPICADRESMLHALRNLIENAVKHGGNNGGRVRIAADRTTLAGKPAVRIGIQDQGPGIPMEERKLIFEPFFRGKRAMDDQVHGAGLGLNLAKRIIEAHAGTLTLRSELGQGSEFLATIPAAVQTPQ